MSTDNQVLMEFAELAGAIGAGLRSFGGGGFSSVAIDSRAVIPGALFVALIGSARDGHRYAEAAFKAGAVGVMAARSRLEDRSLGREEIARKARGVLVGVENTLEGLQNAARVYLEKFPALLRVGITGSSGKTTTKEIAAAMIGREKPVVMNPGNLNSETGLPLSVFGIRPGHEGGIFELGMNRQGEIAELAGVLKPQLALITNIGSAHIGIFGKREEIAKEKKEIFSEFTGIETALIPEDDDFRDFLAEGIRGRVIRYGRRNCSALGPVRALELEGTEITWEGIPVRYPLPGTYNLNNALAAAALARLVPVGPEAIRGGLGSVKPLFGRSEILRKEGPVTVIRDCYNSNPESAAGVIDFCDALRWPGRRIYVIGAMLELGDRSPGAHRELGRRLAASRADMVFLYGAETGAARRAMEETPGGPDKVPFFHTDIMKVLTEAVIGYIKPGDLVLLKGSRGCALEQVAQAMPEGVT